MRTALAGELRPLPTAACLGSLTLCRRTFSGCRLSCKGLHAELCPPACAAHTPYGCAPPCPTPLPQPIHPRAHRFPPIGSPFQINFLPANATPAGMSPLTDTRPSPSLVPCGGPGPLSCSCADCPDGSGCQPVRRGEGAAAGQGAGACAASARPAWPHHAWVLMGTGDCVCTVAANAPELTQHQGDACTTPHPCRPGPCPRF